MADDRATLIFTLENPREIAGSDQAIHVIEVSVGDNVLDAALSHKLEIEHACGGECACSTCHIHVTEGMERLCEASDAELDRVDEAPGVGLDSRLACQCVIEKPGVIHVTVPDWNRNAVKEGG